jgi:hypothetical protein
VTYAIAILIVTCAVQSWLLWRLGRALGGLKRFEEQLARSTQGLSLLVDTSEAGFAMLGNELGKLAGGAPRRTSSKVTTRRVATAAAQGREVEEIAARQGLSEGEVRLRLSLAAAESSAGAGRDGGVRGQVRA